MSQHSPPSGPPNVMTTTRTTTGFGHTYRSVLRHHVLPPLAVTAAFLYARKNAPSSAQWLVSSAKPIILGLLALFVLASANRALNLWATNNWRMTPSASWGAWSDEIAVVTGGSGDIGQALVRGLMARGVRVAVLDTRPPPLSLMEEINDAEEERVVFVKCDVSRPEEIATAKDAIRRAFGGENAHPSILINNAGMISTGTPILSATESDLRASTGVNVLAHWFTTQAFLPAMLERNKGHVVTISSLASYVALPASVSYAAHKAAALAFHEGLTCEIKHLYKSPGVVASIAHPAFVKTQMTRAIWDEVEGAGVRLLTVDEVAGPVLRQIFAGRGGQIFVPRTHVLVSQLRSWPNWAQELVRDAFGRAKRGPIDSPYVR